METSWADIEDFPSVKKQMSASKWKEVGSKQQYSKKRTLVSGQTKDVALTLALLAATEGNPLISHTELARRLWGIRRGETGFDAKRISVTESAKTLRDFGLADIKEPSTPST